MTDKEHWGSSQGGAANVMYFGLRKAGDSKDEAFMEFSGSGNHSLSYASVNAGFTAVRSRREFERRLAEAKDGNQHVFVVVNGIPYLADRDGWIKLSSADAPVMIDNNTVLPANQLNRVIQRNKIKSMTPLASARAKYAIYTTND